MKKLLLVLLVPLSGCNYDYKPGECFTSNYPNHILYSKLISIESNKMGNILTYEFVDGTDLEISVRTRYYDSFVSVYGTLGSDHSNLINCSIFETEYVRQKIKSLESSLDSLQNSLKSIQDSLERKKK